jgi:lipopolysaccharide export system permease protein
MKIWHRYFLKEFFKTFFLFLLCFYGLYCLIDYSGHTSSLNHSHGSFGIRDIIFYYLSEFSRRFDIIVPFGLLLATARTLLLFNSRSELVALMAGGYSLRSLLAPFLLVGLAMTLLSYANEEWLQPIASRHIKSIEDRYAILKKKKRGIPTAHHILLGDGSLLIFQTYLEDQELFKDLFWIRSTDDITRMESLKAFSTPPEGFGVEQLRRQKEGHMNVVNAYDVVALNDFVLNKNQLMETIAQPTLFSISHLWQKIPESPKSEKEAAVLTAFTKKMLLPWLSLFAILITAPFCVVFGRQIPTFMIYACSIFALVALYLVFDAGEVIAKRQLVHPYTALFTPLVLAGIYPLWKYMRVR